MSKTLAVFGATGQQGGSVISNLLADPELSKQYKIRAITRDTNALKAKQLTDKGLEVVQADLTDKSSIESALSGAHTVFIVTTPTLFVPDAKTAFDTELNTIQQAADVAIASGVSYIIFSTLPYISKITGGKHTKVIPFDAKAAGEEYIRTLPVKSAFLSLASYMENFAGQPFLAPVKEVGKDGSETWVMSRHAAPNSPFALIGCTADAGKFTNAILSNPSAYAGKTLHAAEKIYTMTEICEIMSKTTGKSVVYRQIPKEEFKGNLEKVLPVPLLVEIFADAFEAQGEWGYFGKDEVETTKWAREQVGGKLVGLEEYLRENPLVLA